MSNQTQELTTKLIRAAKFGDLELLNTLLERGADVNARDIAGRTPLIWAVWYGRVECARLLLDHGANVNAISKSGLTPMIAAALLHRGGCAGLLLERGANVDVNATGTNVGGSPLMCCADARAEA